MSLSTMLRTHNRRITGAMALIVVLGATGLAGRPAAAHEAKCPYCKMDVVQDTQTMDNEVALKYGRKRIEYRCVYCAIADANKKVKSDLTILAPSEVKGKPVLIARKDGKWTASPETAVFVAEQVSHRYCQVGYRAMTDKAGFDAYVAKHQTHVKDAKPHTLDEVVALAK